MSEFNNSNETGTDSVLDSDVQDFAVGQPVGTIGHTNASEAADSIKFLSRSLINVDLDRNPRQRSKYDRKKASMAWLCRSLLQHGLQEPLVVSQRADGTYWLLKGHRRLAAIVIVATEGLEKSGSGIDTLPALAADPDFMVKVRCRVLKGLTIQGEMDILMDHADIVGLTRQEKLLAAKILTQYGFTHDFIAKKVGMSRPNYSNSLGKLLMMPTCVEEAYLSEDKDAPDITQAALKALAAAYDADQKSPGARLKVAGPQFATVWEQVGNGLATDKSMSRKNIRTLAGSISDPDIRELLEAISNDQGQDAGTAIQRLTARLKAGPIQFNTVGTDVKTISEGIVNTVGGFDRADD